MSEKANAWRRQSPGNTGWRRSARPGASNKFFMVSADCHANEPNDFLAKRIDPKLAHRLPRVEVDEKGERWQITEGYRPGRIPY